MGEKPGVAQPVRDLFSIRDPWEDKAVLGPTPTMISAILIKSI